MNIERHTLGRKTLSYREVQIVVIFCSYTLDYFSIANTDQPDFVERNFQIFVHVSIAIKDGVLAQTPPSTYARSLPTGVTDGNAVGAAELAIIMSTIDFCLSLATPG